MATNAQAKQDQKKTDPDAQQDRKTAVQPKDIPGWGMDADPENDPTYPMKHTNGADHQRLNYERPPQQRIDMEIFHSVERPGITRVFGTSTPPRGLSGAIRRYAYQHSEATAAHWMTLILADRVDVVEGIINDLKHGIVPNLWVERGWRAEWKINRMGLVQKMAIGAIAVTVALIVLSRKTAEKS
jgi:hypothetical protein